MRVILIGPPGAGKGTQAANIKARYETAHISTGDILRENVRENSLLGIAAKSFMEAGKLVPDDLIVGMMKARLSKRDAVSGFLLDGFPRTISQAESLDALLKETSVSLDAVLLLEVSDNEVVRRLANRRVCSSCGAIYNAIAHPSKSEGVCDECGSEVIQRGDDKESVIRNRLAVYHKQTSPLIDYYEKRGLLHRVDGEKASDTAAAYLDSIDVR